MRNLAFKCMRLIFGSTKLNDAELARSLDIIKIRNADKSDLDWVRKELEEGARLRHFAPSVETEAGRFLPAMLSNGCIDMQNHRGGKIFLSKKVAYALVAEVNGKPAAFLISLCEGDEIELHLAGTLKIFRRKGCLGILIRHMVTRNLKVNKIYARCYTKSTWAKSCLEKEGFKVTKNGNPCELTYHSSY